MAYRGQRRFPPALGASPRITASSYAMSAASRQAARTVSTKIDGVSARCDIEYSGAYQCERYSARDVPTTARRQAIVSFQKIPEAFTL
jgi:hypothetical protein